MKNFDIKHFFTMIGLVFLVLGVWALMILSLIDYAKYGDYPMLTHDPNAYADE